MEYDDFSTMEIIKALGIPRERLRDWMNRGYIVPAVKARGQGTKASFTRRNVYGIELFKRLVALGFKRETASVICNTSFFMDSPYADEDLSFMKRQDRLIAFFDFENGEKILRALWSVEKDENSMMDLRTGEIHDVDRPEKIKRHETDIWESIVVIKVDTIIKKVDMALSAVR